MKPIIRLSISGLVMLGAVGTAPPASAFIAKYYIDEATDFTGNGCPSGDVNTITAQLQTSLNNAGWPGSRYVNADAWPQDFYESCSSSFGSGGVDSLYADNAFFAVYAGHGLVGGNNLFFGFPNLGQCNVFLSTNARLGSMDGADAGYGMYLTSCTLKISSLVGGANFQWTNQNMGFHNSPSIQAVSPKQAFDCSSISGGQNSYCFTHFLEPDISGDHTNSPVVVSYGESAADAENVRDIARLKGGVYGSTRDDGPACEEGQPSFFYAWVRINHGAGPC